jgi:hypothetical protein
VGEGGAGDHCCAGCAGGVSTASLMTQKSHDPETLRTYASPNLDVYILSTYGEYGAEDVCATLDRSKLEQMVSENWPTDPMPRAWTSEEKWREHMAEWRTTALAGLRTLLQKTDEELASQRDGWNCQDAWGGMMLHVVRLAK